jgi:hypothetical protein
MEEPGLHGPGIAWRRHLQGKAPESLGRTGGRAADDMSDLALSAVHEFLEPGSAGPACDHPRSGTNGMVVSWRMRVAFEPPAFGYVANSRSRPLSRCATKKCRIASPSMRRYAPGCRDRRLVGLNTKRLISCRTAGPGPVSAFRSNFGV